jgi:hypothetical protein
MSSAREFVLGYGQSATPHFAAWLKRVQATDAPHPNRQRVVKRVWRTPHEDDADPDRVRSAEIQLTEEEAERFLVLRRRQDDVPQALNLGHARPCPARFRANR